MASNYIADPQRYDGRMNYRRCGQWGLKLPAITLGFWHTFGGDNVTELQREIVYTAFDQGITHFDLANNYGPPYGSAEVNAGRILKSLPRHEIVVSSKAGYDMWPGPYGEWGSRKYLLNSLDQSLERLDMQYVDLFYSHRFDPDTPIEETLGALNSAVEQGRLFTQVLVAIVLIRLLKLSVSAKRMAGRQSLYTNRTIQCLIGGSKQVYWILLKIMGWESLPFVHSIKDY